MGVIEGLLGAMPIIGPMFNAISTSETNATNREINEEQMKFNAEQAQLSRDWSEKMWNLSNQYSSPVQQMQRLADAGLNPHLVYHSGADTTAASVPAGQSATAGSLKAMENPRYGDMMIQAMQMRNLEAQTKNLEAENEVKKETARGQKISNDIAEATKDTQIDIKNLEKRQQTHKNAILANESYQKSLQSEVVEKELEKIEVELQFFEENQEVNLSKAKQDLHDAHMLALKQVEVMSSEVAKNFAAATAYQADIALKKFDLQYKKDTRNKNIEILSATLHKLKEEGYKAMESGKTEVYKQYLMNAQKSLTDIMTSKGYQDLDSGAQKMLIDLFKSSFQIVKGE